MNSRLKIHCIFLLVLLICAIITPVIAASEGSGITGWILTTQDIKRVFSGYEVNNGENQGNTVGFHAEGMYPWVNAYFSDSNEIQADYTIISNKWMAYSKNSAGVVKSIVIDYSVFSYWDSPTRDQEMQRITGSMPFHQKYGSSKSIQLGNAGRAYITPVYDSATGNVYHIEFSKGYVYATLNVQIPKDQTGEALSIRIAEELEKKIPATITVPPPTPVKASFTLSPQSGFAPLTVTFTDTSVGNPVSRLWKFHDGQTVSTKIVRFTYNNPGSYMVYLTVTGSDESTSTVTTTVKVLTPVTSVIPVTTIIPVPPPVARIYASTTTGDAPLRVQFGDHSSGSISTRVWTFGDGYRSEISEPGHTFQKAGTYTVKLTVNGAGGSDTEILVINVGDSVTGTPVTSQVTTPITPGPSRTEVPVTPTVTATTVNTDKGDQEDTGTKVAESTVAAVVAVAGAAAAAGVAAGAAAGTIPGAGGRPPGSSQDLQDEYRRLLDTIATEKANRDAWAREGKDSGRDGMISTLEEEAERRRKELEELGAIPDYEGRVEGHVGPSDREKELGDLEDKLQPIDNWAYNEYSDLFNTELDYQKSLQEQRIRQAEWDAGRINTVTMVGGLSGTGSEALNMATFGISGAGFKAYTDPSLGGVLNLRRPLQFIDNMRENYTAEHVRDMILPLEETKTLIRAAQGEAEWHEVVGATSSGFLKVLTLGRISKGMMGEKPVTEDIISKAIREDSLARANENIKIQKENLEFLKGLKEKVQTIEGKKVMPMDETMEILCNPDKGRIMKNPATEIPTEVREAYANTRKEINQIHDATLKEWAKENIEELKNADVEVLDFSTPGKDPLLPSVDRDYRLVAEVLERDSTGKPVVFREVDPQLWKDKSQQTFAEITKAPENVSSSHYAETHQYEATTKFDTQACRDFSDQIINKEGEIVTGEPNILKVKRGESLLEDPQGFSEMWKDKVSRAPTSSEAVQQAGKCIEQYEQVKNGTARFLSGRTGEIKLGKISDPVQTQINTIKEYIKDPTSKEANVALAREVPDINQFMEKMDGHIRALPRKLRGGF